MAIKRFGLLAGGGDAPGLNAVIHAVVLTAYNCYGWEVVGILTIDNDLAATDVTIGFNTAINTATEARDMLQATAESQHRVMMLEVMGRNTGWIALKGNEIVQAPMEDAIRLKFVEPCGTMVQTARDLGIVFG
jgi:6-phosphofructokinase